MASSSASSLSRYRPTIIITTAIAAGLAGYLLYTSQASSPTLHRSNAVRRQRQRRSRERQNEEVAESTEQQDDGARNQALRARLRFLEQSPATEGHVIIQANGSRFQFNMITFAEDLAALDPSHGFLEGQDINDIYNNVLHVFLGAEFENRQMSTVEMGILNAWLNQHGFPPECIMNAFRRHNDTIREGAEPEIQVDGIDDPHRESGESIAGTDFLWPAQPPHPQQPDDDHHDAQTLRRAVFHIAEESARNQGVIHRGIQCDQCGARPIYGIRWRCANCADFDLCSDCEANNGHYKTHLFYKVRIPAPYLGYPKRPLPIVYPGKPEEMPHSLDRALKRRLVDETNTMKVDEIEALWDQFTCLANAPWKDDPNGVNWAIDRKAFNASFIPHYSNSYPSPNLVYDRIFAFYDENGDGLIGYEEFIKGLDKLHSRDLRLRLRTAFDGYDMDKNGFVSRKDFLRMFRAVYAITMEATRDHIDVALEELSAAGAVDTILSSKPLSSTFTQFRVPSRTRSHRLDGKTYDRFGDPQLLDTSIVADDLEDIASRSDVLEDLLRSEDSSRPELSTSHDALSNRWRRRQFFVDEEEGLVAPNGFNHYDEASTEPVQEQEDGNNNDDGEDDDDDDDDDEEDAEEEEEEEEEEGEEEEDEGEDDDKEEDGEEEGGSHNETSSNTVTEISDHPNGSHSVSRGSRSSSRVRFQEDIDFETRSNASTSSRPIGERWGGYEIPEAEKDLGTDILYQITQQGFNELLDPLFKDKEDLALEARATASERRRWRAKIEEYSAEKSGDDIFSPETDAGLPPVDLMTYAGEHGVDAFGLIRITAKYLSEQIEGGRISNRHAVVIWNDIKDRLRFQVLPDEFDASLIKVISVLLEHGNDKPVETLNQLLLDQEPAPAFSTQSYRGSSNSLLDGEIVEMPLEELLRDSGYAQREDVSGSDSLEIINADMASTVIFHPEDTEYRDPTLPQNRPNSDAEWSSRSSEPVLLTRTATTTTDSLPSPESTKDYAFKLLQSAHNREEWVRLARDMLDHTGPLRTPVAFPDFDPSPWVDHFVSNLYVTDPLDRLTPIEMGDPTKEPNAARLERLALLTKVEDEIRDRGGPGRISFEEFERIVMSEDLKLRFVESWLDCVSI